MSFYQLKINVRGSKSANWRRVIVPADFEFNDLHYIIQKIFGLGDCHLYKFILEDGFITIMGPGMDYDGYDSVDYQQCIGDLLDVEDEFVYHYDFGDDWFFDIVVEQECEDNLDVTRVIDYEGYNLIEDCGGIDEYNRIATINSNLGDLKFNLDKINKELDGERLLIESDLKNDYIFILDSLIKVITQRNIDTHQVLKITNCNKDIYWLIIKTKEGFVLRLFDHYKHLLAGFYNLDNLNINHIFLCGWTFMLSNQPLPIDLTIDEQNHYAVFRNDPGYLPSLITVEEGEYIFRYLQDLLIGLQHDKNSSDVDEIIEIIINDDKYIESSVFVHEPQVDLNDYDFNYFGREEITTKIERHDRVCIDIVALPPVSIEHIEELQLLAVVSSNEDYVIKEIELPTNRMMNVALVDALVSFSNEFGKPKTIVVNNMNILFLLIGFISYEDIDYDVDNISLIIDKALQDAYGIEAVDSEKDDDPFIENLMEQLEGLDEDEIEEKLNEMLANLEMLN